MAVIPALLVVIVGLCVLLVVDRRYLRNLIVQLEETVENCHRKHNILREGRDAMERLYKSTLNSRSEVEAAAAATRAELDVASKAFYELKVNYERLLAEKAAIYVAPKPPSIKDMAKVEVKTVKKRPSRGEPKKKSKRRKIGGGR